jgi:hypothetical protein
LVAALVVVGLAAAGAVFAQTPDVGLEYAQEIGLSTVDIRTMVARIINVFFGLLGLVVVSLFLYAGFLWMTAQGNPDQVQTAKKVMINATIGLIIVLSAYAIARFILWAATGGNQYGGVSSSGSGGSSLSSTYCQGCGPDQLGNGIIDYNYPEDGQTDVPRNTKIAITFKRPMVLSTVFLDYDDKDTFSVSDDEFCPAGCDSATRTAVSTCAAATTEAACTGIGGYSSVANTYLCAWSSTASVCRPNYLLNTDNFKVIPVASLVAATTFDARYPTDTTTGILLDANTPKAAVSPNITSYSPTADNRQTLVIRPVEWIGSSLNPMNYRVGLRGGTSGIEVWSAPSSGTEPVAKPAFSRLNADGSYYWSFTTSITADTTPPQLKALVPRTKVNPSSSELDRNQLLQIWFDEAIDPTTVSGESGSVSGLLVEAKCLTSGCAFGSDSFVTVEGKFSLGNKYRTVEFIPSAECEGVSTNSCGDTVYCLPKDVELRVTAVAATVSSANPPAADSDPADGITDMVGNSFDGDASGTAEGPGTVGSSSSNTATVNGYAVNKWSDTLSCTYQVGDTIDLIPPKVTAAVPAANASSVSGSNPITFTWSKSMSSSSLISGKESDTDPKATVILKAKEYKKTGECTVGSGGSLTCPTEELGPPGYSLSMELQEDTDGDQYSTVSINHRTFFTANELGWTEDDSAFEGSIPRIEPWVRSIIKDTKQNCFYPSEGVQCNTTSSMDSCCDTTAADSPLDCPISQ